MKTKVRISKFQNVFVALTAAVLAACSSQPELQSGPDAEITKDGLVRVDHSTFSKTYVKPGMDLSKYDRMYVVTAGTDYRDVTTSPAERYGGSGRNEYPLDEKQRAEFEKLVDEVFEEEFTNSKYFVMAEGPGEDVLLVVGGMVDVVSFVPPERAARDTVYLAELGQATLVLELRDSLTNEPLARAADRRRVEPNRGTLQASSKPRNQQEVKRVIRRWAKQLVAGLDELHEQGTVPSAAD